MLGSAYKQPDEQLDYDIDFSQWLYDGDVITSVETEVMLPYVNPSYAPPAGTDLTVSSTQINGQVIKIWVINGINGKQYEIKVRALTSGGRIKDECFKIRVRDC